MGFSFGGLARGSWPACWSTRRRNTFGGDCHSTAYGSFWLSLVGLPGCQAASGLIRPPRLRPGHLYPAVGVTTLFMFFGTLYANRVP